MDADLEQTLHLLTQEGATIKDIFGELSGSNRAPYELLFSKYSQLKTVLDSPEADANENEQLVLRARKELQRHYVNARYFLAQKSSAHVDHMRAELISKEPAFSTDSFSYYLGEPLAQGTISTVYEGEHADEEDFLGRVAIKIADQSEDNELLWRERRVLKLLFEKNGPQLKHLPIILDHFKTEDGRICLVFRCLSKCCNVYSLRENYKNGVDRKHMVWMLNRALSAIGYAHSLGVVHGNLEPSHLMIRPKDHNLFILDWCWSIVDPVRTRDRFRVFTENFSAPEVQENYIPTPAADLYSLGKMP